MGHTFRPLALSADRLEPAVEGLLWRMVTARITATPPGLLADEINGRSPAAPTTPAPSRASM